jgi:hypothetical protein
LKRWDGGGHPTRKSSPRRRRAGRWRLADTEPVEELHREIGAGTHRLVVRTRHIDPTIALLDPEMGGLGGRWRALLAARSTRRRGR